MKSIEHYEQLAREAKTEGCTARWRGRAICRCGGESYKRPAAGPLWMRCVRCLDYISLGPATDTADVLVEIQLAACLAEIYTLWEPGADRDTAEMVTIATAQHPVTEPYTGECFEDGEP